MTTALASQMDVQSWIRRLEVEAYVKRLGLMLDRFEIGAFVEEFTEDGRYRLIPRENHDAGYIVCIIDDSKKRLRYRRGLIEKHWHFEKFHELRMLSTMDVKLDGDAAHATTNFVLVRSNDDGVSILHLAGVFEDDLVTIDGRWRIRERLAILDSYLPYEAIPVPP